MSLAQSFLLDKTSPFRIQRHDSLVGHCHWEMGLILLSLSFFFLSVFGAIPCSRFHPSCSIRLHHFEFRGVILRSATVTCKRVYCYPSRSFLSIFGAIPCFPFPSLTACAGLLLLYPSRPFLSIFGAIPCSRFHRSCSIRLHHFEFRGMILWSATVTRKRSYCYYIPHVLFFVSVFGEIPCFPFSSLTACASFKLGKVKVGRAEVV